MADGSREEQARRLVEEALPCQCGWEPHWRSHNSDCPAHYRADLVRRLVPVFERAERVREIAAVAFSEEQLLRTKLERAEAERDSAQRQLQAGVVNAIKDYENLSDETKRLVGLTRQKDLSDTLMLTARELRIITIENDSLRAKLERAEVAVAQLREALTLTEAEAVVVQDYEHARELGQLESALRTAYNLWKIIRRQRAALAATEPGDPT